MQGPLTGIGIFGNMFGYDLSHLKTTVSAGESVNPEIVEKWRSMTVTNRPNMPVKLGSMGVALPGIEIGTSTPDGQKLVSISQTNSSMPTLNSTR
jgi:acyl-coenzyme A synthetase/AMP-(fatty) acid ligase